jgi:hypothetical protein
VGFVLQHAAVPSQQVRQAALLTAQDLHYSRKGGCEGVWGG